MIKLNKANLIEKTNAFMSFIFGDKPDEQYEYEKALYHNMMGTSTNEEKELIAEFEQAHPVDAVDSREDIKAYMKKEKPNCLDSLRFVKPNRHVGEDIFAHPFTGSYEHKDENGNWVEGPALGHGYEGGFNYDWSPDDFFSRAKTKILNSVGIYEEHT